MPIEIKIKKFGGSGFVSEKQPRKTTLALILSVGGNLFLAGWFLIALLNPIAHVNFIVQTGLWLFLVEFFSIFVSGFGERSIRFRFANILSTAFMFAIAFGWLFLGNIYLPLIFLGSTLAKIFGQQATSGESYRIYAIPLFLGSTLAVSMIGPEFWVNLFPFPENFSQFQPADWAKRIESGEISGEFVERPQTMLVWGIIYFTLVAVIEFALFKKRIESCFSRWYKVLIIYFKKQNE